MPIRCVIFRRSRRSPQDLRLAERLRRRSGSDPVKLSGVKRLFLAASLLPFAALSAAQSSLLYVADSGGTTGTDKLWSFSAFDGSVVSNNVFTDASLTTFLQATQLGDGSYIVVDQGAGATGGGVRRYGANGAKLFDYVVGTTALNQFRPGAIVGGDFYFGISGGDAGTIYRVPVAGGAPTRFATIPASGNGTSSVWGILPVSDGLVITNSASTSGTNPNARVQKVSFDGLTVTDLVVSTSAQGTNGTTGLLFPQQVSLDTDGDLLVAGFSGASRIYEYGATGTFKTATDTGGGNRGVIRLGDGGLLTTQGTRVIKVAADGTQTTVVEGSATGNSFRAITTGAPVPEPATFAALGLGVLALLRRRRA